ncbi:hypothetical protein OUZ56_031761 [Daphnia magna]|uniref:Uncharacterized protein n=1 Tax=Daphnia magna TaxID=35525 RepID=A0ABQ9ZVG3_9CRUS|nr:hypothetical protein OUZ56_031761 [Daphnia magna]
MFVRQAEALVRILSILQELNTSNPCFNKWHVKSAETAVEVLLIFHLDNPDTKKASVTCKQIPVSPVHLYGYYNVEGRHLSQKRATFEDVIIHPRRRGLFMSSKAIHEWTFLLEKGESKASGVVFVYHQHCMSRFHLTNSVSDPTPSYVILSIDELADLIIIKGRL